MTSVPTPRKGYRVVNGATGEPVAYFPDGLPGAILAMEWAMAANTEQAATEGIGQHFHEAYTRPDLYATDSCPAAGACLGCGLTAVHPHEPTDVAPLVLTTATTMLGVLCVTLCRACLVLPSPFRLSMRDVVERVGQHCTHLGITVDDMASEMVVEDVDSLAGTIGGWTNGGAL